MILQRYDFVSTVWAFDSTEARWSVWLIKRIATDKWELAVTWDEKEDNEVTVCKTVYHRVLLKNAVHDHETQLRVESKVLQVENQQEATRLAKIEIHSSDPETIINEIFEYARNDSYLNFRIVVLDK